MKPLLLAFLISAPLADAQETAPEELETLCQALYSPLREGHEDESVMIRERATMRLIEAIRLEHGRPFGQMPVAQRMWNFSVVSERTERVFNVDNESEDWDLRERVKRVRAAGPLPLRAASDLLARLSHENERTRQRAAGALTLGYSPAHEALLGSDQALAAFLSENQALLASLRQAPAAELLAGIRRNGPEAYLRKALSEECLSRNPGAPGLIARGAGKEILQAFNDGTLGLSSTEDYERALDALLARIAREPGSKDADVKLAALAMIELPVLRSEARARQAAAFLDQPGSVREAAARTLLAYGAEAAPVAGDLYPVLQTAQDQQFRRQIIELLVAVKPDADTAVAIAGLLSNSDYAARLAALDGLYELGEAVAAQVPAVRGRLADSDDKVAARAIAILLSQSPGAQTAADLAALLAHPSARRREDALNGLKQSGEAARAHAAAIRERLQDQAGDVRHAAARTIAAVWTPQAALKELEPLLSSAVADERITGLHGFGTLLRRLPGRERLPYETKVRALLQDPDPEVRRAAEKVLDGAGLRPPPKNKRKR